MEKPFRSISGEQTQPSEFGVNCLSDKDPKKKCCKSSKKKKKKGKYCKRCPKLLLN
jgi:hypothetical protein